MSRFGHIARSGYSPIGFGPDLILIVEKVFLVNTDVVLTMEVWVDMTLQAKRGFSQLD